MQVSWQDDIISFNINIYLLKGALEQGEVLSPAEAEGEMVLSMEMSEAVTSLMQNI